MADRPTSELDKVIVRLPDGMRDQLKTIAAENGRSMNAEIVHRLEVSLSGANRVVLTDPKFQREMLIAMRMLAESYANTSEDPSIRDAAKKETDALGRLLDQASDTIRNKPR